MLKTVKINEIVVKRKRRFRDLIGLKKLLFSLNINVYDEQKNTKYPPRIKYKDKYRNIANLKSCKEHVCFYVRNICSNKIC